MDTQKRHHRTQSATTKLTAEQYVTVKVQAEEQGIALSDYIRRTLLSAPRAATFNPVEALLQAQLQETLALRSIVLNLAGDQASDIPLTPERLRDVCARADANKATRARMLLPATTNIQPVLALSSKDKDAA